MASESARRFASIAGQLFVAGSLAEVLTRVASVATDVVPGCTSCSVTIIEHGAPVTAAGAGAGAYQSDQAQYQAGEGPCLMALREPLVMSATISTDPRWPRLGAIYSSPLESVASFDLYEAWADPDVAEPPASLNVYGSGTDAFDEESTELGLLLAAHASMAMLVVGQLEAANRLSAQLGDALASRDVIGQAKGILMERSRLNADDAFDVLRRTSQTYNRKLRDVADRLALTGELPTDKDDGQRVGRSGGSGSCSSRR